MTALPAHLQGISRIVMDEAVVNAPIARRVRDKLPHLTPETLAEGESLTPGLDREDILYLKRYKGRFLRHCPGTSHYRCCGYQIIHIGENCPLRCSYCILQAYFQDRVLKVWANQDDLWAELERAFESVPGRRYRVGTGEFTDSLVLEALTGYSRDLVEFLGRFPQVCLELKSKVVDLSWMDAVRDPSRVLPAWSMNAPLIAEREEQGECAGLEERLAAAKRCAEAGFRVCLHFDPVIHFPGWQDGYARTVEMIFDHLRPENIAYVSIGSFRHMPDLKRCISENFPQSSYIYGEFVTGIDGKQRLLRPLRVEQLRFLADRLKGGGLDRQLYLCMESDEVWRAVLSRTPDDLGGLYRHLMAQAFGD
ncbi:SPL family radical SAM protein [Desulfomicrobium salsuginis]